MSLVGFTLLGSIEAPTITGAATGVPLLVKPNTEFTAAMLLKLDVGGGDLRFSSDAAGLNQLPCEIVDGLDIVWVKPTDVSISTGATLYVWGDNTGAVQPTFTDPFGRDAVWVGLNRGFHGGDLKSDISGNIAAGTFNGTETVGSDSYGNYTDLNGTSNRISQAAIGTHTTLTLSTIVRADSITGFRNVFAHGDYAANARLYFGIDGAALQTRIGSTALTSGSISIGAIAHLTAVISSGSVTHYINGSATNSASAYSGSAGSSLANTTAIGSYLQTDGAANSYFDGKVYGLYIDSGAKSPSQIAIEYDNQSTTGSWWIASDVAGGISITESVVNSNYASLDPAILLTGSISVTESLVNANYAAINPIVTLTGSISITESIVNANYTSLNPVIDLTGIVSVAESLVNSNYISLDPVINLTSGAIEIIESTAGTQYAVFNPSILLTPEPLGIVSTVCFNGELVDLNYSGQSGILEFSGQLETAIFNGEFNALDFSGTIQTTCADGDIQTNC